MRLALLFARRPVRRSTLRDLHAFGVISVFRRHSIFRLWEPLREHPGHYDDFAG
jgi:hypothetical protein